VREVVTAPVAAVLSRKKMPVDIRHNAKIDRAALAAWATDVLDGKRART
jgi:olefin beta-lactone synthetase